MGLRGGMEINDAMKKTCLAVILCLLCACAAQAAQAFTYLDLIKRLTDLESLAVLPEAGEKCEQASSYDRKSVYDAAAGKYVKWEANGDGKGGGMIPTEGDLLVLGEMQGPGCIWRIWSAAPGDGHVRIYLDGATEPVVDLPFKAYFTRKEAPFLYKSLVHDTSAGKNCYVPIPYQKSCRILADKDWGNYYHFTYTTYPKGTVMPTFRRELSAEETAALEAANTFLTTQLGTDPAGSRKGEKTEVKSLALPPSGQPVLVTKIKGPRAITAIKVKVDPAWLKVPRAWLREVALQIRWDGEEKPSVWVPIGDFFGTAPGTNFYKSLPCGMTETEFYSFWYMAFGKEAVVELVNDGEYPAALELSVTSAPLARPIKGTGRFHAKWHRDVLLPPEPERWIDWPMLVTHGQGRFCGVMLHVWNPKGGWWGEGDEKFHVDGEKFPSTFGTGSEDYFGYAWCNPALFQNCYHNQTHNDGDNKGHVSVNRWHITDNVPFMTSFEGYIEKYYKNDKPTWYAATAFWYQAPGGRDPYEPVSGADRWGFYTEDVPARVEGAIEAEDMNIISCKGGRATEQNQGNMGPWSGGAQLWWRRAGIGGKLTLALPVREAGKYAVKAQFVKSWDFGIAQAYLDGRKLGEPIDLYNPDPVPGGEVDFGVHQLKAGEHKLMLEMVGINEKAVKACHAGIDYVRLVAVQ